MFSTKHRLRHDKDVQRVLKGKKGVFDAVCGVKYAPNGLLHPRFTVVVGSKVSKHAVDRNRMRRQYREIIRTNLTKIVPGFDILLLVSKPALDMDYASKELRLMGVMGKAGLLRPATAVA